MSATSSELPDSPRLRVIGPGRAGGALSLALGRQGWQITEPLRRGDDLSGAAQDVDVVLIATPDSQVAPVASAVRAEPGVLVVHLAAILGPEALASHQRRAALHPLVAMPSPELGSQRLNGAWFAVAGDPAVSRIAEDLGGRWFTVADQHRSSYHAAAAIASNHLAALLGQAERVAATAGVGLDVYLDLVRSTVENVAELGPAGALTGPAARGDDETLQQHREALDPSELATYDAMVAEARRLAGQRRR